MATGVRGLRCVAGSFTKRNGTGTQDVTVVSGFGKPRIVFLNWTNQTAAGFNAGESGGFGIIVRRLDDTIQKAYIAWASDDNVATTNNGKGCNTTACCKIFSNGTPTVIDVADLSSVGSWPTDGFQLNWTTGSANATIIHFEAWTGLDLEGYVGSFTGPASAQQKSYTGVGWVPSGAIFMSGPIAALGDSAGMLVGIGAAASPTARCAYSWAQADASTMTSRTKSYQTQSACWTTLSTASPPALSEKADLVGFESDGFRLNHITVTQASAVFVAFLVRGALVDAEGFLSNSGTGSQAFTNGFKPLGGVFMGAPSSTTTLDAVNAEDHNAFGFFDGTAEESTWTSGDDTINTDSNSRFQTTKLLQACTNPSTVACEADFTSFDADGFTINWSTAAQRRFGFLVMGDQYDVTTQAARHPPLRILRSAIR